MKNEFDHRVLGAKYDLFSFFDEGPGFPVWHDHGLRIKNALIDYWRSVHRLNGYKEIESPILLDKELWKISGHCDYFEENMFFSSVEKRDFAIKPMSCPGAILLFKQEKRSHAELPMRLCELGHVHRNEDSGSLHGLLRVRSFVQDDAHIFCRERDLLSEIKSIIYLIKEIMQHSGLSDFHFELSSRGENKESFLGNDQEWKMAEDKLKQAVSESGYQLIERPGEAKFYGPSLDLHIKDIHGKNWQCSSIQLDFNLPNRFKLHYFDEHQKKQVPYMIHRAIFGSLERFIAILLENFGKQLPFWISPIHYKILPLSDSINDYLSEIVEVLSQNNFYYEIDRSDKPLREKIRHSYSEFIDRLIIVGEAEKVERKVVIKSLRKGSQESILLKELVHWQSNGKQKELREEVEY